MRQVKPSYVLRVVLCIVLLVLAYVVQSSLGVRISLLGTHIDLIPLLVAAAGILLGPGAGIACGFAAGLLYDISASGAEGLYPLYYLLCGMSCGILRRRFLAHPVYGTMLCSGAILLAMSALRYLFYFQFSEMSLLLFVQSMGLQLVFAVVLSPIAVALVRLVSKRKRPPEVPMQTAEGGSDGQA